MAFMSRNAFLDLAKRKPWAALAAFRQGYQNARGNEAERQHIFDCGIAAAPHMIAVQEGWPKAAGTHLGEDLECLSQSSTNQDATSKAAQLTDLCLEQLAGNDALYWRAMLCRLRAREELKEPMPLVRHKTSRLHLVNDASDVAAQRPKHVLPQIALRLVVGGGK